MYREINKEQNYVDKLLRLIPSEIVAAYLIITGIIPDQAIKVGHILISIILFIIIPFYMWRVLNVKNKLQIITTSIAFIIWIYSFNGGPFSYLGLYKPWIASIILILWTVVMPILVVPEQEEEKIKSSNKSKKTKSK